MSFGWSAGDIATSVKLIYKLIQALDSADGAASDYREAVAFLRELNRTLEPLQTFTAWNRYPEYGGYIKDHVAKIKDPVDAFLAAVLKFEPTLGNPEHGHHRHVFRKLQWAIVLSKKVTNLRKEIESHMRIINSLLQRLTLDIVQALPENLRATFQDTLRPELMPILLENLQPLNTAFLEFRDLHIADHKESISKVSDHHEILASSLEDIKHQIGSSNEIQTRIESCLQGFVMEWREKVKPALKHSTETGQPRLCEEESKPSEEDQVDSISQDSLSQVYYLVFLYLGHFLQNLFLVLSRMVQPSPALMPALLAKYNISFLDAIGRPPRILPYEYFKCFKVLEAFVQHEFRELPGSSWIDQGKYMILSLANNQTLNEKNWRQEVTPGSTVAMSIVIKKLGYTTPSKVIYCPRRACVGVWLKPKIRCWMKCLICKNEVLNTIFKMSRDDIMSPDAVSRSTNDSLLRGSPSSLTEDAKAADFSENDTSFFKRIVHQEWIQKVGSRTHQSNSTSGNGNSEEIKTVPGGIINDSNEEPAKPSAPVYMSRRSNRRGINTSIDLFGWWKCCQCSTAINPAFHGNDCTNCNPHHAKCSDCKQL